jgi:outer membrane protein TolC
VSTPLASARRRVALAARLAGALAGALAATLSPVAAQQPSGGARPYPFEEFARVVRANHPVARQARLAADQADAEVRVARGAFDPTVTASWDQKTFGSTRYYDYVSAALKIPTPLGADIKVAYDRTRGRYFTPDRRTPNAGLLTAGISLPLGQRLLTDERRNALAVARALRDVADGDRAAAVNRLLLDAAKDYARWFETTRRIEVSREGVSLAEFRLRAVRARVVNGDAAAIDTVEALVELQRRQVQQAEAEQGAFAAELTVTAYVWDARGQPAPLPTDVAPVADGPTGFTLDGADVPSLVARAERRHPNVIRAQGRVEQAAAQRRFVAQQLIPFAEAELGSLADAGAGGTAPPFETEGDYKAGLTARVPLLFMKERGRLDAASARLDQQSAERQRVRRDVGNAVRIAANDLATTERLLDIQRVTVTQAELLRAGEQRKFENGESTLFLVNARERLVLDERLKLAALEAKALGARAELAVSVGDEGALVAEPR